MGSHGLAWRITSERSPRRKRRRKRKAKARKKPKRERRRKQKQRRQRGRRGRRKRGRSMFTPERRMASLSPEERRRKGRRALSPRKTKPKSECKSTMFRRKQQRSSISMLPNCKRWKRKKLARHR